MPYSYSTHERLLSAFETIFRDQPYKHRDQSLGNWVAAHLYDDLLNVNRSTKYVERVQKDRGVRHRDVRVCTRHLLTSRRLLMRSALF